MIHLTTADRRIFVDQILSRLDPGHQQILRAVLIDEDPPAPAVQIAIEHAATRLGLDPLRTIPTILTVHPKTPAERRYRKRISERKRMRTAAKRAYDLRRIANMTPEQLDRKRTQARESARRRAASMTPEQIEARRAYHRACYRRYRATERRTKETT